jgi:hypothetical protein
MIALGCAACSGGSTKSGAGITTTATPAGAPTSAPPNVTAQLLTLADLPAGWSVDNSSGSSTSSLKGCNTSLDLKPQEIARGEASFKNGTNLPAIGEIIAAFSTPARASSAYGEGTQAANACKTFAITDNGHTYNGNAGQMSLGTSYGDKTTAYQFTVDVQGFSFGIDLVAVLKGSEVMSFEYADLGTPDLQTVNSFVGMAASKLP